MAGENIFPKPSAQIVVKVLESYGVRDVVISPGTRDTPLILACDASEILRCHSVVDERTAAFVGLGIASCSRRPVALVCTSGSAMLNYAPALAEAYYRHIPLIAISADRPQQWIDQSDSQTIRQEGALSAIVKKSVVIHDIDISNKEMLRYAARLCTDAVADSMRVPEGPVHINMPFDVPLGPLYPKVNEISVPCVLNSDSSISTQGIKRLAGECEGKKILVVCGIMPPDNRLNKAIGRLAAVPGVVVVAESLANLHAKGIISNIDATLGELDKTAASPDLVIVCGGALVSARLKKYLRSLGDCEQWHVASYCDMLQDTFHKLSLAIESTPRKFFPAFTSLLARNRKKAFIDDSFRHMWHQAYDKTRKHYGDFISDAPWSELKAVASILGAIPENFNLHLSNGTAIRYALLHPLKNIHGIWCNRGVSGIEGATSTAVGAALCYKGSTMLITGDMSCSYDIGALSLHQIPRNFKIVVLSNAGGGIFRVIDKTSSLPQREQYFCAAPRLPLRELAEAYGFHYYSADSKESLDECLNPFLSNDEAPSILEVKVDPERSAEVFKQYHSEIQ